MNTKNIEHKLFELDFRLKEIETLNLPARKKLKMLLEIKKEVNIIINSFNNRNETRGFTYSLN